MNTLQVYWFVTTLIIIGGLGFTWWCLLQIYKQLVFISRVLTEMHITLMQEIKIRQEWEKSDLAAEFKAAFPNTDPYGNPIGGKKH